MSLSKFFLCRSGDTDGCGAFEQEARAVAALNHPNILAIYDIGTREGALFIISELLEGESAAQAPFRRALPVRKAIEYAVQMRRVGGCARERHCPSRPASGEHSSSPATAV